MKCITEATPTKPAMVYMVLLYRNGLQLVTDVKYWMFIYCYLGSIVPGGIIVINLDIVRVFASIKV